MVGGRIEAYLFSSGSKTAYESTNTITAGGSDAILAAPALFTDALAQWTASLGGAYSVTWIAASQAVRVANSGAFAMLFVGNLHRALGFASATGYASATSYTGTLQALARFDLVTVQCSPITDGSGADLRSFRHGRAESFHFGNADYFALVLWMTADQAASFTVSYCIAGRVRIYQDPAVTTVYSATNAAGYLDGYIGEVEGIDTHRNDEDVVAVRLSLAVPR